MIDIDIDMKLYSVVISFQNVDKFTDWWYTEWCSIYSVGIDIQSKVVICIYVECFERHTG